MVAKPTHTDIETFAHTVIASLVRAEATGRLAPRFTDDGPQLWKAFRNELTLGDLLDLAIQDAAVLYPQPFSIHWLWSRVTDNEFRVIAPEQVTEWVDQAVRLQKQPTDAFLWVLAEHLDIRPPEQEKLEYLPDPKAHHQILELPGSGGWLAYHISTRPDAGSYYWENFTIVCGTWQEQLLAGLIAFELGAPPHRELPIVHISSLAQVLDEGAAFDWIIGLREENARRADALRSFLKPEGQIVLL
jgi:hypothetical protein